LFKGKLKFIEDFKCSWLIHSTKRARPSKIFKELVECVRL